MCFFLRLRECGLHVERAGRIRPSEVRHATVDGKYPSNTSKIIQQSLLPPFSTVSLISPTQGFSCSWFICPYLHPYSTTLVLTLSLFTKIGFRGWFIHKGIDFNPCLLFHFSFFMPSPFFRLLANGERRKGERSSRRRRRERPLLACIFISTAWCWCFFFFRILSSHSRFWIRLS